MSLRDIWNWLINADLLVGLKYFAIAIAALLGIFVVILVVGKVIDVYHEWLGDWYEKHPKLANGFYIVHH